MWIVSCSVPDSSFCGPGLLSESFFLNRCLPQKYLKWLWKNIFSLWTVQLSYLSSSPRVVLRSFFSPGSWFLWHYSFFKNCFGKFLIYLLSVSSMCQGFLIVIKLGLFFLFWLHIFFLPFNGNLKPYAMKGYANLSDVYWRVESFEKSHWFCVM